MVAIKNSEADRFLETPPNHIFGYLVYGTDTGLIHERATGLFKRFSRSGDEAFNSVRLSGDDLASDQSLLADEVYSAGLFGGKRAVLIESGSKNFFPSVEKILADPPVDCILIIEAGSLRKDSPLRSSFERSRVAASIECYPDSVSDLQRLVKSEVILAGLTIADDVAAELVSHLGSDRAATRSEIEKLILYAHDNGRIEFRHIDEIVADASSLAIDAAISSAFLGDRVSVTETTIRAFEMSNDPGVLLGFAFRHAITLHRARIALDSGATFDSATAQLVRGNRGSAMRKSVSDQIGLWTHARLLKIIDGLGEAIRRCRRESRIDQLIAIRAMWSVSQGAKSKG